MLSIKPDLQSALCGNQNASSLLQLIVCLPRFQISGFHEILTGLSWLQQTAPSGAGRAGARSGAAAQLVVHSAPSTPAQPARQPLRAPKGEGPCLPGTFIRHACRAAPGLYSLFDPLIYSTPWTHITGHSICPIGNRCFMRLEYFRYWQVYQGTSLCPVCPIGSREPTLPLCGLLSWRANVLEYQHGPVSLRGNACGLQAPAHNVMTSSQTRPKGAHWAGSWILSYPLPRTFSALGPSRELGGPLPIALPALLLRSATGQGAKLRHHKRS